MNLSLGKRNSRPKEPWHKKQKELKRCATPAIYCVLGYGNELFVHALRQATCPQHATRYCQAFVIWSGILVTTVAPCHKSNNKVQRKCECVFCVLGFMLGHLLWEGHCWHSFVIFLISVAVISSYSYRHNNFHLTQSRALCTCIDTRAVWHCIGHECVFSREEVTISEAVASETYSFVIRSISWSAYTQTAAHLQRVLHLHASRVFRTVLLCVLKAASSVLCYPHKQRTTYDSAAENAR